MTDCPTREYIIRETTYPDATKQEAIGELVRCKDCRYYHGSACYAKDANGFGHFWYDNDFCSYGERKDVNDGKTD